MRACLLLILLTLAACTGPRSPVVPRERALTWHRPMELRILEIHDGLHHSRDPNVSHLIEAEILTGDGAGKEITFPYDEWSSELRLPSAGDKLVVAPSQWILPGKNSRGKPRDPLLER